MIIAYASANADPISNPSSDPSLDLSSLSLPQTVQVYGAAQDTSDPSAPFSWSWSVMYPESGVTLSDDTAQNPTVTCTEWRNVRLHLIATNTATAETSEANVLLAPSSSFVEVRVLSAPLTAFKRSLVGAAHGTRRLRSGPTCSTLRSLR